ncbi:RNA polymerase sigma factor SigX [Sediminibacillus massiliensis]|uniref:RNA polymerase sigma factor SigX n=1 Tax=Sediminibacillus massiliensis TaxID=1926277 RepID=UPI0009883CF9|nr:RNA polymerase sigma factor SigX [Sediminibacillus massiliensis]
MKAAFQQLYEEYHNDLFQFIMYMVKNKEQAEDLVQEVYIRVLKSYDTFKGDSSEKTWLFSIARHVSIDYFRRQQSRRKRILDIFDWGEKAHLVRDEGALPEEISLLNEEMKMVYRCLDKCTLDQKSVVILRYVQSFSIEETAKTLGWSISKVKTTQHRAIKALRRFIEQENGEEGDAE